MKYRKPLILMVGTTVLVIITVAVNSAIIAASRSRPDANPPPQIGGQQAPAEVREFDFGKRYDVYCSFAGKESTVFRGCRVVGFTGPDAPADDRSRSSSGISSGTTSRYFDRWLILELNDGRLAYIPPSAINYLETAKTP